MPRSFFDQSQPTLEDQLEHGVRLWHETAKKSISNADEFFAKASEYMDFDAHRKRIAFLKELYSKQDDVLISEQYCVIETLDSDEDPRGDGRKERVISAEETRDNLLTYDFRMPCAQTIEMLVVTGHRVPVDWPEGKQYPFNGFYISAHYFAEAKSFLKEGDERAAWVALTRAYYYLGVNSSPMTAAEASGIAVEKRHAVTNELTAVIVRIARACSKKQSKKPLGLKYAAKVIADELLLHHHELVIRYHTSHHGEKRGTPSKRDITSTLAGQIQRWSESSTTNAHPEIREAMLPFKSARGRKVAEVEADDVEGRQFL